MELIVPEPRGFFKAEPSSAASPYRCPLWALAVQSLFVRNRAVEERKGAVYVE